MNGYERPTRSLHQKSLVDLEARSRGYMRLCDALRPPEGELAALALYVNYLPSVFLLLCTMFPIYDVNPVGRMFAWYTL